MRDLNPLGDRGIFVVKSGRRTYSGREAAATTTAVLIRLAGLAAPWPVRELHPLCSVPALLAVELTPGV